MTELTEADKAALRPLWDEALAEVRAAEAIAADPITSAATGLVHLEGGWRALGKLWRLKSNEAEGIGLDAEAAVRWLPEEPASLRDDTLAWLEKLRRDAVKLDEVGELRRRTQVLVMALHAAEYELFGASLSHQARRRLILAGAAAMAVAVPLAVVVWQTAPEMGEGPWIAHYYDNPRFEGDPIVQPEGNVVYDWDIGSAWAGGPVDGFSARWETCLVIDEPGPVSFLLASDDGSRLRVDGKVVVDNWGTHRHRSKGATIELQAGVHHLEVEYFEEVGEASVALHASLDGRRPTALPVRQLRRPGPDGC